jgi:hypothetical protein
VTSGCHAVPFLSRISATLSFSLFLSPSLTSFPGFRCLNLCRPSLCWPVGAHVRLLAELRNRRGRPPHLRHGATLGHCAMVPH